MITENQAPSSLTDEEINAMVKNAAAIAENPVPQPQQKQRTRLTRNVLVIGAGDGGCNIASGIKNAIPEVYAIAYNTSSRAVNTLHVDMVITPNAEDGSGKDRSYSKDVFKRAAYKTLVELVKDATAKMQFDYIFVTTTADGGTGGGASPNIAKVVADNVSVPVIVIGVYPALAEDAKAQYNTIAWQAEIEKTGLPYMIFDNQARANYPKLLMQLSVNDEITVAMLVLTGESYGNTNISAIDNRDMHMILIEAGKRINVYSSTMKPKVGITLDEYLENVLANAAQPDPVGYGAIGVFVKGPSSMISALDTSLIDFRAKHGDALMYTHIEESPDVCISLITSGSGIPEARLNEIKDRYDELTTKAATSTVTAASVLDQIDDPFAIKKNNPVKDSDEDDFSGLDL